MANTQVTGDLIADGAITAAKLSNVTTDTISEGTALYYTDARVASYLSANSYATEGYVTTAVNNLVDAAPASLDTLNELAAALNDDANFATTVTNALATKLNLSGGNITGNLSVDTDLLFVDTANDRVGIGTSSPSQALHIGNGSASKYIRLQGSVADSYVGSDSVGTFLGNTTFSPIYFNTNSLERMRITSTGNVGIGTSSPAGKLAVNGNLEVTPAGNIFTATTSGIFFNGYDSFAVGVFNDNSGSVIFQTNSAQRMRITSTGNVGIGTTSPSVPLTVRANGAGVAVRFLGRAADGFSFLTFRNSSDSATRGEIGLSDGQNMLFYTGTTERMRITSGGNVLVGNTTSGYNAAGVELDPAGAVLATRSAATVMWVNRLNNTGILIEFGYNTAPKGNISTNGSTVSYNTSSDYRLKENVVPIEGALDRVSQLQPARFNFIADPNTIVDGFLAHQVEEVVPEAVTGEKDAVDEEGNPVYQGIDQSKLTPLLTAAIQELKDIVDQQQTEIDNLKAQLK